MKESKQLLIPADGNCLYTTIILSYLLSVIDNQRFFRERVKHLSGFDQKFADEFRLKLLAKYNHPTNLHLSLSMKQMITALITKAKIKENIWGGVEEIQKIALTFKLNIWVYLDNRVIMGQAFSEEYDRYVLENPAQPIVGALGTIHVLRCRASEAEIPNTKSRAEFMAKIASAEGGEFQHYRILDMTDGISNALYLGLSALNRFEDTEDWAATSSSLIPQVIQPVMFPVKLNSEDASTDDDNNDFNGEPNKRLSDHLLKTVVKTVIGSDQLAQRIEDFLKGLKSRDFAKLTVSDLSVIERQYLNINYYLSTPHLVSMGVNAYSIDLMNEKYRPKLLQIATKIHNARIRLNLQTTSQELYFEKNDQESVRVYHAGKQMATLFKQKIAYSALRSGSKFIKAKAFARTDLSRLKQPNVIREQSKKNVAKLKLALAQGVTHKKGRKLPKYLRDDESQIYKALLNIPYQCQHATKFYYPLRRDGRLASYAEIRRQHPDYVSEFSTGGNVKKLGNDGFVFFRVIVPPLNSKKTQYGDTRLIVNLDILAEEGWVSLHEQLVPIPALNGHQRRSEIHFMKGKRILRQAEMVKIHNNTVDPTMQDGIKYTYRTEKFPVKNPFSSGKADLKTKFSEKNNKTRQFSFIDEIFYGPDIRRGIALSVIQELRYLEECGYRNFVLGEFQKLNTRQDQHLFLAELIKGFFRIEGKYPVSLQVKCTEREDKVILSSTSRLSTGSLDFRAEVDNPDGDGSVDPDLSLNVTDMRIKQLEAYKKKLKEKIRFHGMSRGTCNKKGDKAGIEKYDLKIIKKQALYDKAEEELAGLRSADLEKFRNELVSEFDADPEDAKRIALSKLDIMFDGYYTLLCEQIVTFNQLFRCSRMKLDAFVNYFSDALNDERVTLDELMLLSDARLDILSRTNIGDLIGDNFMDLSDLKSLSDEELERFGNADLRKAVDERGFDINTLLRLFSESPIKFECATCEDLSELALSYAPNVPHEIQEYVKEFDDEIDWEFVNNSLGETDSMLLDSELGYF